MNAVSIYLLRTKFWQILALVIGLCVLGQMVAAISLIRSMESTGEFDGHQLI
jgi:pentatricopeptide repeat protein